MRGYPHFAYFPGEHRDFRIFIGSLTKDSFKQVINYKAAMVLAKVPLGFTFAEKI